MKNPIDRSLPRQRALRHQPMLIALGLLMAIPLGAQDPAADLFAEEVDVRVVNLEVVVTEGGERVAGLGSDDFRLLVDGEERPIDFFTEIRGGTAVEARAAVTGATTPAVEAGQQIGTRYLVFVDDLFSIETRRNKILDRLKADLDRLSAEDSMAIVAYDGESIDLLAPWTHSRAELGQAFDRARTRSSYGLRQRSRERFDQDFAFAAQGRQERTTQLGLNQDTIGNDYVRPGQLLFEDVEGVVEATAASLRALAGVEGRKVVLLLSGGWPAFGVDWDGFGDSDSENDPPLTATQPNADAWNGDIRGDDFAGLLEGQRIYSPLIETANRLGYTLYPVDVPGAQAPFYDTAQGNAAAARQHLLSTIYEEQYQEGMLVEIADRTGGLALLDGAGLDSMQRVTDDTRSYYSIGFTPDWQANDERHEVEVVIAGGKSQGKKYRIRARGSFSDLSRQTETSLRLESAQLFDVALPSQGDLELAMGEPEKSGFRKMLVPIRLRIPVDRITYLPTGGGWATQLEMRIALTDDQGQRTDIPVIPIVHRRQTEPRAGEFYVHDAKLEVRKRGHRMHVSIFDTASGAELSERMEIGFDGT